MSQVGKHVMEVLWTMEGSLQNESHCYVSGYLV